MTNIVQYEYTRRLTCAFQPAFRTTLHPTSTIYAPLHYTTPFVRGDHRQGIPRKSISRTWNTERHEDETDHKMSADSCCICVLRPLSTGRTYERHRCCVSWVEWSSCSGKRGGKWLRNRFMCGCYLIGVVCRSDDIDVDLTEPQCAGTKCGEGFTIEHARCDSWRWRIIGSRWGAWRRREGRSGQLSPRNSVVV